MDRPARRRLLPLTIELSALTKQADCRYLFCWSKTATSGLNAEKIWAYVAGAALLLSAASAFV
jgi:hypothetical protein